MATSSDISDSLDDRSNISAVLAGTYCCVPGANRGELTMVFKRLDTIVKGVIEDARKAGETRSTISGTSPTEFEGGDRPHREDSSRPPCAGKGGKPAQTESERAPDPKARPVQGEVCVDTVGPKPGDLAFSHRGRMAPILRVIDGKREPRQSQHAMARRGLGSRLTLVQ